MTYKAISDKIIAKKVTEEEISAGGLVLPANSKNRRFNEATIIDVDPNFTTSVKIGDNIRYHATLFEYDDGIIILREDHISAIIKPD